MRTMSIRRSPGELHLVKALNVCIFKWLKDREELFYPETFYFQPLDEIADNIVR